MSAGTGAAPAAGVLEELMGRQSILIIDDDLIWHNLIGRFLAGTGYIVYGAATCADGVKQAALHKPDCIVLDFHLTDGDAVTVCSALRSDDTTKKIPVIIFSSDPAAEITAYAQCRADNFLLKGEGSLNKLPAAIKRILRPAFSVQSDG